MELLYVYDEYKKINKELVEYLNNILSNEEGLNSNSNIDKTINRFIDSLEKIKNNADSIELTNSNNQNLNDLKYLIVSTLFLLGDLEHFYRINELTRFKMRAVNYINHARRSGK